MSAPFEARYPGRCSTCDEKITPGQQVRFVGIHGSLEHVECPQPSAPGGICGSCQMEVPAGLSECPDCYA